MTGLQYRYVGIIGVGDRDKKTDFKKSDFRKSVFCREKPRKTDRKK